MKYQTVPACCAVGSELTVRRAGAGSDKRGYVMETILIIVVLVFLLGGGGWGYSRWRR
jgi:hypothetical protein